MTYVSSSGICLVPIIAVFHCAGALWDQIGQKIQELNLTLRVSKTAGSNIANPNLCLSRPTLLAPQPPTQIRDRQPWLQSNDIQGGAVSAFRTVGNDGECFRVKIPELVGGSHGRLEIL